MLMVNIHNSREKVLAVLCLSVGLDHHLFTLKLRLVREAAVCNPEHPYLSQRWCCLNKKN